MASAKLANSTVNQSQTVICRVKPIPDAPEKMSRIRKIVVSAAPTSTTNITGFFVKVTGFSLPKEATTARLTISGSKSGRERASFLGSSEVVSSSGGRCAGGGTTDTVDMLAPQRQDDREESAGL